MDDAQVENLSATEELIDPDLEVLLALLQGPAVPAIAVLELVANLATVAQAAVQISRDSGDKVREAREILYRMEDALLDAGNLHRQAKEFVLLHNYTHVKVWPAGVNGMQLSYEAYNHYMGLVDQICKLIQSIDHDAMRLSAYARILYSVTRPNSEAPAQWQIDLHRSQKLLEKVLKAPTFGEKTRALGWSLRLCREVVVAFNRAVGDSYANLHASAGQVYPQQPCITPNHSNLQQDGDQQQDDQTLWSRNG